MVASHSLDVMKIIYMPYTVTFRAFNGTLGSKDMPFPFNEGWVKKWVAESDIGFMVNRFRKTIPTVEKHVKYMKVEMAPPSVSEVLAAPGQLMSVWNTWRTGGWKDIKVEDAWVNFLICLELLFWFFIGEIIGRGSILGYKLTAMDKKVVVDEQGNEKTVNYMRVRFPGERVYNNWGKQLVGVDWSEENKITAREVFWCGNLSGMVRKCWNGFCAGNMNAFDNFI